MKTVFPPNGKTKMSNVESSLFTGNGDNIAIMDGITHSL
jgi:hypothetical protein